jgi:hypothetical protein
MCWQNQQEENARSPKEALSRLNIDLLIPIHNLIINA